MRVKLLANELTDGEIDFVSLVKHGANRSPFKIIKTEDLPEGSRMDNLKDKLNAMFGKTEAGVSAWFVKSGEEEAYISRIQNAGYSTDNAERMGDVTIYKQEGFDADRDVSLVAIDCNLGMAFDRVVKEFAPYPMSADFDENIGAAAFFPGLHNAMEALAESIWNALNSSTDTSTAGDTIDKNLRSFRSHVNALVKNLPASVIKMEYEGLANGIGGSTLDSDAAEVIKTEDGKMTTIKEAMAGDLAGLNETEGRDMAVLKAADARADAATIADAAQGAEIVFLDAEGNEISEEEFSKSGGKKMKKMKDGKMMDMEEEKKMKKSDEDDSSEIAPTEGAPSTDVSKMDVMGQGDSAFSGKSPGSAVVQSTSDTGAVSLDEGLPAGFRTMQKSVKKFEEGKLVDAFAKFLVNDETGEEIFVEYVAKEEVVAEEPATDIAAVISGPLDLFGKALNAQTAMLDKINERLEKQDAKIEALQKTSEEAVEKADKTALVDHGYDLDESLGLMNGHRPVSKSATQPADGSIWKGLSPELDALEARFGGQS
jgi:hypothetical protein